MRRSPCKPCGQPCVQDSWPRSRRPRRASIANNTGCGRRKITKRVYAPSPSDAPGVLSGGENHSRLHTRRQACCWAWHSALKSAACKVAIMFKFASSISNKASVSQRTRQYKMGAEPQRRRSFAPMPPDCFPHDGWTVMQQYHTHLNRWRIKREPLRCTPACA